MIIRHHPGAYWADSLSGDELGRFRAVKGDAFMASGKGTACNFDVVACVPE